MINFVDMGIGALVSAGLTWGAHIPGQRASARRIKKAEADLEGEHAEAEARTRAEVEAVRGAMQKQLNVARDEAASRWQYAQCLVSELEHLVERRLPAVTQEVQGVRVRIVVGLARPDLFDGTDVAEYLSAAEDAVREAGTVVRRSVEDSARAGVRVAAEEIQASLARAQLDIDNGLDDAEGPIGAASGALAGGSGSVLAMLSRLDHSVTLAFHVAQRLRILANSWPGVQRANCTIAEIVESARGRARKPELVDYTYRQETGEAVVDGLVVEPVIMALTELLDNATEYSGDTVSVHVQRFPNGMRITVEDRGLGMSPLQLEEAEQALSTGSADVTNLDEPSKAGFKVIGRLTDVYGLRVGLAPSASGGTRADLLVPAARLTAEISAAPGPTARDAAPHGAAFRVLDEAAEDTDGMSRHRGVTEPETAGTFVSPQQAEEAPSVTAHGLPKRQPRTPTRRHAATSQQVITDDADDFAAGFGELTDVLAEEYRSDTHVNEG